MKLRSLAIGLTLLTAGTVIGVSTQQFASADVTAGDRPVLVPIEPCRLVDTRPAALVGPRATPLGAAETLTVDAQQPATPCTGAISTDALSLSLNVTAIGASDRTFLTIWAGGDRPDSSSLNPAPGAPPTPNAVTVDLSVDQEFEVYNNLGSVNLIVDVNGYYANHNHDDRYYTKTEVDGQVASSKSIALANRTEQASGPYDIDFAIVVPDDYTPGTDVRVEVMIQPGLDAPCVVDLARNYVWAARPGEPANLPGGFGSNLLVEIEPADPRFDFTSTSGVQVQALEFTVDVGDLIQAGDSLAFGFFQLASTTCTTGSILGATLYYE